MEGMVATVPRAGLPQNFRTAGRGIPALTPQGFFGSANESSVFVVPKELAKRQGVNKGGQEGKRAWPGRRLLLPSRCRPRC